MADRPQTEGALRGAVEILKLQATLPNSAIERQPLFAAATLRRIWPQVVTALKGEDETEPIKFADACQVAHSWQKQCLNPMDLAAFYDQALLNWEISGSAGHEDGKAIKGKVVETDKSLLHWGCQLVRWQKDLTLSENDLARLLQSLTADIAGSGQAAVAARKRLLADALATLLTMFSEEQLAGLLTVMRRKLQTRAFAQGLKGFVDLVASFSDQDRLTLAAKMDQLLIDLETIPDRLPVAEFQTLYQQIFAQNDG